jgi:dTDP-4-amino-4,6-dideoxygalactose transaminase
MQIPFNKPFTSSSELNNILDALEKGKISGDGYYTQQCHHWFAEVYHTTALLTHSCTAALEMAAILLDLKPGDEVIMPSYTFVSTANAFVLRGAVPVFVDIRPDTLNLDETKLEAAITEKTKAIVPVHYAGVACEMDEIMAIAKKHRLYVVEDAAQGFGATYKGRLLGTIGHLGTLSFHETKNVISGEGGALLINAPDFVERAEIIREKGTNRSRFFRGQVDKYTWVDVGSSFLPSDLIAAFLYAQLQHHQQITQQRRHLWQGYHDFLADYETVGRLRRPFCPDSVVHNAHMYYLLLDSLEERSAFIECLKAHDIMSVFHYIPLHSSPAGLQYGKTPFQMPVTDRVSDTLVRLPLFYGLTPEQQAHILTTLRLFFN